MKFGDKIVSLVKYYTGDIFDTKKVLRERLTFDNLLIGKQEADLVENFLKEGNLSKYSDDAIQRYKNVLAQYIGINPKTIFLFYSAHSSLYFLLSYLKRKHPDKKRVIVSGFTCTVVINAIVASGLEPVFVDIEDKTFGLDIMNLEKVLSNSADILAVIVQHLFGIRANNSSQIANLCKNKGIYSICDAAQSLGTFYNGKSIGLENDFVFFSSQASKNLNTYTGGILVNNRMDLNLKGNYEQIDEPDYEHVKKILKAYIISYKIKKVNKFLLPLYKFLNKKNLIPSLHCSELAHYNDTQYYKINDKKIIYLAKFPAILAEIGIIQLNRLEKNIQRRLEDKKVIEKSLNINIKIDTNVRPSLLRIPYLKNQQYKQKQRFEEDCLIGIWFNYSYGGCKIAEEMAKSLVNFVRISEYYVDL